MGQEIMASSVPEREQSFEKTHKSNIYSIFQLSGYERTLHIVPASQVVNRKKSRSERETFPHIRKKAPLFEFFRAVTDIFHHAEYSGPLGNLSPVALILIIVLE